MKKNQMTQDILIIRNIVKEENTIAWEKQWNYLNRTLTSRGGQRSERVINQLKVDLKKIIDSNDENIIEKIIEEIINNKETTEKIKNFTVFTDTDIATFREKIYAYENDGSYIRLAYSSNNEQDRNKPAVILDKKKLQFILQELLENKYQSKREKEVKEAKKRYTTLKQIWNLLGSTLVEKEPAALEVKTLYSGDNLYGSSTGGRNKIYKYSINAKKVVAANSTTKKKNKSKSKRR